MKHKTGIALGIGSVVALVLALAPSWAEAGGRRGRAHRGQAWLAERLDLTPEQAAEIRKLRLTHRKEEIQRRAALQVLRLELGELLAAPELEGDAIQAKARALAEQQAASTRARIEHRLAVARVLTPEQRSRARDLLGASRAGRRARHALGAERGWRGRGPGRMAGWGWDGPGSELQAGAALGDEGGRE